MGRARARLDWEEQFKLALDPELARKIRTERASADEDACTMCGDFCALKIVNSNYDLCK
jgi:phosphomethylpyrimidine synthase